jgi:succinylarginine dihydrolase
VQQQMLRPSRCGAGQVLRLLLVAGQDEGRVRHHERAELELAACTCGARTAWNGSATLDYCHPNDAPGMLGDLQTCSRCTSASPGPAI